MRRIPLAAAAALLAAPAMAQDRPRLPLFEAGIFAGTAWLPDYPASAQNHVRIVPLPYLIYRGELLRSDERGVRGRIFRGEDLEFSLSFNGSLRASSRHNRAREGMPNLDYLGEVGPAVRWVPWRDGSRRRITLELPFRVVFSSDFSQTHYRGYIFAPELAFEQTGLFFPQSRARIGIGPVFGSGRFMDYFYQVRGEFGRPDRPAFDAHGGYLGTRLQFSYRVPVTDRITIGAGGRVENFSGATNADSPLFRREFNFTLIGGVSFALYRSEATVASTTQPFD